MQHRYHLAVALLLAPGSALRAPAFAPPPPLPSASWESPVLKAVGAAYATYPIAIVNSRSMISNVFGLETETFEQNLREPAAGFLALYSPLGVLEGALCFALAGAVALSAEDRSRTGAALASTSGATLLALAAAFASGLEVTNVPALFAATALVATSGGLGLRAVGAIDDPVAKYKEDAAAIIPFAV